MTYCIAVSVDAGLVLTSDSRTNAGIDSVSIYGKMHAFATVDDRKLVLLSAGNLATTQAVVEQLRRDKRENAMSRMKGNAALIPQRPLLSPGRSATNLPARFWSIRKATVLLLRYRRRICK
jgi:hypothetical protein